MLRVLSAGESHGKAVIAIIDGMPAGLKVDLAQINKELKRRQSGYGRGRRMQIESDKVQALSGLKAGVTLGSPLTLVISNKDSSIERLHKVFCARPGHADLAGLLKYGFKDIREVLERASARSTAATVAVGALCKILLKEFHISINSKVLSIAGEETREGMHKIIQEAMAKRDTVGGIFEVRAKGVPAGFGSYVQPDRRLDARLAQALMAIPGIKGVEIGLGFGYVDNFGSNVHDALYYSKAKGYFRRTNNAGGIEGGISNGADIVLSACMKPIATLMNPLDSVNVLTKRRAKAARERSDTCVVEAAGVIAESAAAYVLTDALIEKFGGDNLADIKGAYQVYLKRIK